MSTEIVTPATLTLAHIAKWDGTEMSRQMSHPEMREAITNVLKGKTLADVEAAARAAVQQPIVEPTDPPALTPEEQATADAAAQAEADRVAQEQEAVRKAAEEAAKPKKVSIDYQVRDEEGNPIGRPTHLEAATEEELRVKLIEAHTQATRAFHRLKKQKLTFKPAEQPTAKVGMSDQDLLAAMRDVRSDDAVKALEAQKKITKNEVDKQREEERAQTAALQEELRQKQVSLSFLHAHANDFNNCQANVKLVGDYIQNNELEWTLDNLEIAFNALESELAPVVKPVAPVAPVNPAPAPAPAPAVTTQVTPPAVQPQVIAPAPAAAPNPAPAAPRPGVNGGLVPGQQSGSRPAVKPAGLTAEEIRSWDGATMAKHMANPAMRAKIDAFVAARNAAKGK